MAGKKPGNRGKGSKGKAEKVNQAIEERAARERRKRLLKEKAKTALMTARAKARKLTKRKKTS